MSGAPGDSADHPRTRSRKRAEEKANAEESAQKKAKEEREKEGETEKPGDGAKTDFKPAKRKCVNFCPPNRNESLGPVRNSSPPV